MIDHKREIRVRIEESRAGGAYSAWSIRDARSGAVLSSGFETPSDARSWASAAGWTITDRVVVQPLRSGKPVVVRG